MINTFKEITRHYHVTDQELERFLIRYHIPARQARIHIQGVSEDLGEPLYFLTEAHEEALRILSSFYTLQRDLQTIEEIEHVEELF